MPQKLLYSECKYGRLVAGQQPFEAVCPCCLTTMLIEACCQVDCGINADIYPLQTANNLILWAVPIIFTVGIKCSAFPAEPVKGGGWTAIYKFYATITLSLLRSFHRPRVQKSHIFTHLLFSPFVFLS